LPPIVHKGSHLHGKRQWPTEDFLCLFQCLPQYQNWLETHWTWPKFLPIGCLVGSQKIPRVHFLYLFTYKVIYSVPVIREWQLRRWPLSTDLTHQFPGTE
jgi:hypothetical protein